MKYDGNVPQQDLDTVMQKFSKKDSSQYIALKEVTMQGDCKLFAIPGKEDDSWTGIFTNAQGETVIRI